MKKINQSINQILQKNYIMVGPVELPLKAVDGSSALSDTAPHPPFIFIVFR